METNPINRILDATQVRQKIKRMAYEIYENHAREKSIVLAGITGQGYILAKLLAKEVEGISHIQVTLAKVLLNKNNPRQDLVEIDCDIKMIKRKAIIVTDDVLNTGQTLAYSLKPFLETEIKSIEVAVLVNRSHTLFPIFPKYTGYQLATTMSDHVEVILGKESAVNLK